MKNKNLFQYLSPMVVIIVTIVMYHYISKETPGDINTFASLSITYAVGAIGCFIMFLITNKKDRNILHEIKKTNWASWVHGLALVTTETGYLYVYRTGWSVSLGSLVVNIILACLMMFIGFLFYKEKIHARQLVGLVVCLGGMALINL